MTVAPINNVDTFPPCKALFFLYNEHMGRWSNTESVLVLVACGISYLMILGPAPGTIHRASLTSLTTADPKLGSEVRLPEEDVDGRPVNSRTTLLVLAGSCTGCSLDAFQPSRLKTPDDWQVIVVYSSKVIPQSLRPENRRHLILSDPKSRFDVLLNATWHPRWYVLSADGKLVQASARSGDWPKDVTYEK